MSSTRSDIYALGVLLYELLTGTLPFDPKTLRQAGFAEIQRIIRESEPSKPSTKISSLGSQDRAVKPEPETQAGDAAAVPAPARGSKALTTAAGIIAHNRRTDLRMLAHGATRRPMN